MRVTIRPKKANERTGAYGKETKQTPDSQTATTDNGRNKADGGGEKGTPKKANKKWKWRMGRGEKEERSELPAAAHNNSSV
jgi:hypothetical protein